MNKVIDSMLAHRSIRSYTDRTVSDEDLNSNMRKSGTHCRSSRIPRVLY